MYIFVRVESDVKMEFTVSEHSFAEGVSPKKKHFTGPYFRESGIGIYGNISTLNLP